MKFKLLKSAFAGVVLNVSGFVNAGIIDFEVDSLGSCLLTTCLNTQGVDFTFSAMAGE